jgi:hypothetical protein
MNVWDMTYDMWIVMLDGLEQIKEQLEEENRRNG